MNKQTQGNQLRIFEHEQFGKVRVVYINGEPWFVGKDITDILAYQNNRDALRVHVDSEDKAAVVIHDGRQNRQMAVINESGLYSLILSSKLPQAKLFRRWVTSEILPSIRKHGAYATQDTLAKMKNNPKFTEALLDALQAEHSKNIELGNKVEELQLRAHYCDMVLLSGEAIPTSVIAKDYGMSAVAFNRLLHDLGIQYKVGTTWVLYQPYANKGYMKTRTFYNPSGDSVIHGYWTQRGRLFLYATLALVGYLPQGELEELAAELAAEFEGLTWDEAAKIAAKLTRDISDEVCFVEFDAFH